MKSKINHIKYLLLVLLMLPINVLLAQGYSLVTPVDLGTYNSDFAKMDTRNTADYDNSFVYGIGSKIVFHKFTITQKMDISLSHSGSELQKTSLKIIKTDRFNTNDIIYSYNTGTSQAYLNVRLDPGIYYVASQGSSSGYNGKITLSIQGRLVVENKLIEVNLNVNDGDSFYYNSIINTVNSKSQWGMRPTNDIYFNFKTYAKATRLRVYTSMDADGGSCVTLLNNNNSLGYECVPRNNPQRKCLEFSMLPPGIYSIVVEGGMTNGDIETYIECTSVLEKNLGEKDSPFEYTDTQITTQSDKNSIYRIVAKKKMDLVLSNTSSFSSGTTVRLLDNSKNVLSSKAFSKGNLLSNTLTVSNLEPGIYFVESGSTTEVGSVTTYIDGHMLSERNLGIIQDDFDILDTQNSEKSRNEWSTRSTNELIYKFTVVNPTIVTLSNSGTLPSGTSLSLTNVSKSQIYASKTFVKDNFSTQNDRVTMTIQPGDYYVISEGVSENGIISTQINLLGQNSNRYKRTNYIREKTYTDESGNKYLDNIKYFDGLGGLQQTIQKGITPTEKDLVVLQEYDVSGRDSLLWLPAVILNTEGFIQNVNLIKLISPTSNGDDSKPYSLSIYESSPLDRIVEKYGPGMDWQKNGKAERTAYLTNIGKSGTTWADADSLVCGLYKTTDVTGTISLSRTTNYGANELFVTRLNDEDGSVSYKFKDKKGLVVLNRRINGGKLYDTNYIYDIYGNLRAVLPPEASDRLLSSSSWVETDTNLKLYAYLYKYDSRNRCIAKKLPGCEWIYYVYDKADRVIYTQDGEQRSGGKNEWLFSIPDVFGRAVLTGICKDTISVSNKVVKGVYANTGSYKRYNIQVDGVNKTFTNTPGILSANYYDNYDFRGMTEIPTTGTEYTVETGYGTQYTGGYKGLLTGTISAQQLSDGTISPTYLYSVMYYDNRGRLIQTKSNNHLSGGIEQEYIAYNFTDQPSQKKHVHSATGKSTQTEVYAYTYDHAGRLKKETYQLNGATAVSLAENTYDELGRLKTNKKGGVANALSTFGYNIRSWTKSITSPLFTETLYYNDKVTAHSYSDYESAYNGNISGMEWQLQGESKRSYRFKYDKLSRLSHAAYNGVLSGGMYNTSYTYDKQGNITGLNRIGKTNTVDYGLIDNLTLSYTGNQLTKVEDGVGLISLAESADFKNYSSVATEYFYNANGAMNKDFNKGITEIQYNSLNLPRQMDIKSPVAEARNEYTYSAGGQKLKVVQKWNPNYSTTPVIGSAINTAALTQTKTTDYVGNKIYENGTLKRILIDGGYIDGGVYHYYLTDHLGNNRVVLNASGTVIQKNHYYPFGTTFAENTVTEQGKQPYKYNGKELDQMHGLNLYDYSARYYESAIGRFTSVDPHAEGYYSWSPYVYVGNNPLIKIDPTGMDWYQDKKTGATFWVEGQKEYVERGGKRYENIGGTYRHFIDDNVAIMYQQDAIIDVYYRDEDKIESDVYIGTSTKKTSLIEELSNSDNLLISFIYNSINDAYVTAQPLTFELLTRGGRVNEFTGGHAFVNLDGTTNYKAINSVTNVIASYFTNIAKLSGFEIPKGISINKLNAAQFSQTYKGSLSKLQPSTRGFLNRVLNKGIDLTNEKVLDANNVTAVTLISNDKKE